MFLLEIWFGASLWFDVLNFLTVFQDKLILFTFPDVLAKYFRSIGLTFRQIHPYPFKFVIFIHLLSHIKWAIWWNFKLVIWVGGQVGFANSWGDSSEINWPLKIWSPVYCHYPIHNIFWFSFLLIFQVASVVRNRSVEMVEALYTMNRVGVGLDCFSNRIYLSWSFILVYFKFCHALKI